MIKKEISIDLLAAQFPEINDLGLLSELKRYSEVIYATENKIIIEYGDQVTHVPMVISGTIKVSRQDENEHELFLYYLSSGDSCAASFSCCMVAKRSEISAVAEEDSILLMVPLKYANEWMEKYPIWRNFIFNMYEQRMYSLIDTIDRLAFTKLDEQLIEYLDLKSEAIKSSLIETTHQEIADDLNVTREAISRLLKKLEQSGKLKLGRNKIYLNN